MSRSPRKGKIRQITEALPVEHGLLPVLAVDAVLAGLLLGESLLHKGCYVLYYTVLYCTILYLHEGVQQPLPLLMVPPLLL